jgi:hypothetical protein
MRLFGLCRENEMVEGLGVWTILMGRVGRRIGLGLVLDVEGVVLHMKFLYISVRRLMKRVSRTC